MLKTNPFCVGEIGGKVHSGVLLIGGCTLTQIKENIWANG